MSTSMRTAARGSLMLTAAHVGLMLSGYGVAVVLARDLGPATYGVYGIVYSVLLGTELIGRLGVPQALAKLIAERSDRPSLLEGTGITMTAIVYMGLFAVFWLLAPQLAEVFRVEDGARLFRIAAIDIPFYGMFFVCEHILNGRRSFGPEAVSVGLYSFVRLAGIMSLLHFGISVSAALIVNVIASVIALMFAAFKVGARSFRPTLRFRRELIRVATPIGVFAFGLQLLHSLDLWSLNAFGADVPDEVKGLYVAAINVARIPNAAAFVLTAVLIPSIAHALANEDTETVKRMVHGVSRFLAVLLLPACALIAVEAKTVLGLLFSDTYRAAGPLLAILIFSHGLLYTVFMAACAILIAGSHAREAALITLSSLPASIVLNALLIRTLGAPGAAIAALLVIGLGVAAAAWLVHRWVASMITPRTLLRALFSATVVAAVASAVRLDGMLLLLEIAVVIGTYAVLVTVLDLVGMDDLKLFVKRRSEAAVAQALAEPEEGGPL